MYQSLVPTLLQDVIFNGTYIILNFQNNGVNFLTILF